MQRQIGTIGETSRPSIEEWHKGNEQWSNWEDQWTTDGVEEQWSYVEVPWQEPEEWSYQEWGSSEEAWASTDPWPASPPIASVLCGAPEPSHEESNQQTLKKEAWFFSLRRAALPQLNQDEYLVMLDSGAELHVCPKEWLRDYAMNAENPEKICGWRMARPWQPMADGRCDWSCSTLPACSAT